MDSQFFSPTAIKSIPMDSGEGAYDAVYPICPALGYDRWWISMGIPQMAAHMHRSVWLHSGSGADSPRSETVKVSGPLLLVPRSEFNIA